MGVEFEHEINVAILGLDNVTAKSVAVKLKCYSDMSVGSVLDSPEFVEDMTPSISVDSIFIEVDDPVEAHVLGTYRKLTVGVLDSRIRAAVEHYLYNEPPAIKEDLVKAIKEQELLVKEDLDDAGAYPANIDDDSE